MKSRHALAQLKALMLNTNSDRQSLFSKLQDAKDTTKARKIMDSSSRSYKLGEWLVQNIHMG